MWVWLAKLLDFYCYRHERVMDIINDRIFCALCEHEDRVRKASAYKEMQRREDARDRGVVIDSEARVVDSGKKFVDSKDYEGLWALYELERAVTEEPRMHWEELDTIDPEQILPSIY